MERSNHRRALLPDYYATFLCIHVVLLGLWPVNFKKIREWKIRVRKRESSTIIHAIHESINKIQSNTEKFLFRLTGLKIAISIRNNSLRLQSFEYNFINVWYLINFRCTIICIKVYWWSGFNFEVIRFIRLGQISRFHVNWS